MKESTTAVVASVITTTCRSGRCLSTMLSLRRANFVHQTCIADFANTCRHTLDTSQSESHLHQVLLPTSKRITACGSLWDDFNGNITIFNAYK